MQAKDGIAFSFIDVVDTQTIHLNIMGFERKPRQMVKAFIGGSKNQHLFHPLCPSFILMILKAHSMSSRKMSEPGSDPNGKYEALRMR
jgi:hypothetical protein